MIKHYFIETNKGKEGPFTFEELSTMKLLDNTKIWHDGLDNWANINDVEELKSIVVKSPPPTKAENEIKVKEYKFSFFKENLGSYFMYSFFAGVALNIAITWTALQPGADKGPFPVYTSYSDREEPFVKLFLPMLPYTLLLTSSLGLIILVVKSVTLNTNEYVVKAGEIETNKSTVVKYFSIVTLDNYKELQFLTPPANNGQDKILIDGQVPNDGYFYSPFMNKIFYIENSIVVNEYLRERFEIKGVGLLDIYCNYQTASKKSAPAFISGKPAPDGIYKLSLFSKITVKDGVVI
jgi:hypothetical protein